MCGKYIAWKSFKIFFYLAFCNKSVQIPKLFWRFSQNCFDYLKLFEKIIWKSIVYLGASVAQWSERSPLTSEAAGSILSENFLNATRTQSCAHAKRVSQYSAESRRFSPGALVSSHRDIHFYKTRVASETWSIYNIFHYPFSWIFYIFHFVQKATLYRLSNTQRRPQKVF